MDLSFSFVTLRADADGDGEATIMDATLIQRHLAGLKVNYQLGKKITGYN